VFALQSYKRKKGRKAGDLSRALIDTTDNSTFVSNVKSVVVRSTSEQEKNYEVEMRKLEMVREKEAQKEEKRAISNVNPDSENGVERFLNEALETDNVSASDTFPATCSRNLFYSPVICYGRRTFSPTHVRTRGLVTAGPSRACWWPKAKQALLRSSMEGRRMRQGAVARPS
jgi:hypothetical protein